MSYMTNAALEGDDIPDERPLRAILFGGNFVALDDSEAFGISASGPSCVRNLAEQLLRAGFGSDRRVHLYRAGCCISKATIAELARVDHV